VTSKRRVNVDGMSKRGVVECSEAQGLGQDVPSSTDNSIYARATGLALLSLASPIAGFFLELLLARRYGSTTTMDAYRITASILATGMQLVFVQVLPLILIPTFMNVRVRSGQTEACRQTLALGAVVTVPAVLVCLIVFTTPQTFAHLLAPGLVGRGFEAATGFVPIIACVVAMLIFCGAMAAVLNCYGVFWTVPTTTLFLNIGIIACSVIWPRHLSETAIRTGMMIGCAAAVGLHLANFNRVVGKVSLQGLSNIRPTAWISTFGPCVPLLCAAAFLTVFNILVFRRLSELAPGSAVTYSFAFRIAGLVNLPLWALVTVSFPEISMANAKSNSAQFRSVTSRTFRNVLFLGASLVILMGVLRRPLAGLLIGHSAMSSSAVNKAGCLIGLLALGAPTGALIGLLQRVLASRRAVWSVPIAGAVTLAIAIMGLARTNDAEGVAVLWDVAFWANAVVLLSAVRFLDLPLQSLLPMSYLAKLVVAVAVVAAIAWGTSTMLTGLGWAFAAILAVTGTAGGIATLAASHWIRLFEEQR
jgi:peptidoglycan biosynthesis protein MviN/MurJ (putative lipid II flippase)